MTEKGEDKLLETAKQIVKALGQTDSMTERIINEYSSFDPGRLSRNKLSDTMTTSALLDDVLHSVDRRLSPLLSSDTPIWFHPTAADSTTSFLSAVDDLLVAIRDWLPLSDDDRFIAASLDRAEDFLRKSMLRLESEFRLLLDHPTSAPVVLHQASSRPHGYAYSSDDPDSETDDGDDEDLIPVARPLTDYNLVIDALPSGTIAELQSIAVRMLNADYSKECSYVYSSCRREFLDESLTRLRLQKMTTDEVHNTPWTDLEDGIERWTKAATVTLRILFPSERRLCDRIFTGVSSSNAADISFMQVCRGPTVQLLSFADAVAVSCRSPERLFRVLDVYETLRDLMPEFELLFSTPYCAALRTEAMSTWLRVGEAIRGILTELENLIRRDPPKQVSDTGGVHPITRYVMNYVRAACKSRGTLEQVFDESSSSSFISGATAPAAASSTTSLSMQMAWIMELLESNLETKMKLYKDNQGLSSIFMMNNGKYILQKVRDSELGAMLGEDWIRKHSMKVKQFYVNYQRTSWNKVLGLLKIDGGSSVVAAAPSVDYNDDEGNPRSLREKLRLFNIYFEETCNVQSKWVVIDEQVRVDLKMSVAETVSVAYKNFLGRFYTSPEGGRNADRYIKYSAEDLEARINNELFQGRK